VVVVLNKKDYRKVDKRVRPGADDEVVEVVAAAINLLLPTGRPAAHESLPAVRQ
jgi:hypothetical protein